MITHELMRELLQDDLKDIRDIAEYVPNEIVYKALIIREYMKEHGIEDPRVGIREFHAYERERLQKLGLGRNARGLRRLDAARSSCQAG